eukprot:4572140-Amphidinium_carterae.1
MGPEKITTSAHNTIPSNRRHLARGKSSWLCDRVKVVSLQTWREKQHVWSKHCGVLSYILSEGFDATDSPWFNTCLGGLIFLRCENMPKTLFLSGVLKRLQSGA